MVPHWMLIYSSTRVDVSVQFHGLHRVLLVSFPAWSYAGLGCFS